MHSFELPHKVKRKWGKVNDYRGIWRGFDDKKRLFCDKIGEFLAMLPSFASLSLLMQNYALNAFASISLQLR